MKEADSPYEPKVNHGAVLVKESFIEPPRISISFHEQSSIPDLDIT